jgi:hypothetical protein
MKTKYTTNKSNFVSEFIQSITNPSTSNEDTKGFILDNEEDLEQQTSSSFMPLNDQEISSTHYNGHGFISYLFLSHHLN